MMNKKELLESRLDAIGVSLSQRDHALALIGLGSVGIQHERLDEYSDLDFFVIVEAGAKAAYMTDLSWLSAPAPIVFQFQNTVDGYKALFDDGVFCEFAIFEPDELTHIPFATGRIVWKQPHVDERIRFPVYQQPVSQPKDVVWLLGEALTNLYVGLGRYHRGEKLAASRLIQVYAVDRILELAPLIEAEQHNVADPFALERRFEQRFPQTAQQLGRFVQGYERSCESAYAILMFLEQHFQVNPHLAQHIRAWCAPADSDA